MYFWRHWHPFFAVHLLYINIGTYCRIRTYVYRYVLSNTYLRLLLWNIKIDKNDRKSISDNNLLNNNVNTVDLYQISPVILSSFLGIPSEFLGNRWQYYSRHLQKIHCILSITLLKYSTGRLSGTIEARNQFLMNCDRHNSFKKRSSSWTQR